ncbi:MAG TPA: carbonic anhydrase, partial [Thermoanaerobaculia bacterium]
MVALALPALAQEKPITPESLWSELMRGNRTFQGNSISYNYLQRDRDDNVDGQTPRVAVLSCADSRVPVELVFHQTIGALFVVRAAGNIADDYGIASLEYAISKNWPRLIVVLGHESCGAVEAALVPGPAPTPALRALLEEIRSSFVGIPYKPGSLRAATEANARASAAALLAKSDLIRNAVVSGAVEIRVAMYDLKSGAVRR